MDDTDPAPEKQYPEGNISVEKNVSLETAQNLVHDCPLFTIVGFEVDIWVGDI